MTCYKPALQWKVVDPRSGSNQFAASFSERALARLSIQTACLIRHSNCYNTC
jgi:hypothetical protein